MRVPGSIKIQDSFVTSTGGSGGSGGGAGGGAASNLPILFQLSQNIQDFDLDLFALYEEIDSESIVAEYVIPYISSTGVRVVVPMFVVNDDISFTLTWFMGPYNLRSGEGSALVGVLFTTTPVSVVGVVDSLYFVEWNLTVDDKFTVGGVADIHFVLRFHYESGGGAVKFGEPLYFLNANKARIGATAGGSPAVYTPAYPVA